MYLSFLEPFWHGIFVNMLTNSENIVDCVLSFLGMVHTRQHMLVSFKWIITVSFSTSLSANFQGLKITFNYHL